nr:MAG TPA: hypothetical protein [Caudoviricetes sp.]
MYIKIGEAYMSSNIIFEIKYYLILVVGRERIFYIETPLPLG